MGLRIFIVLFVLLSACMREEGETSATGEAEAPVPKSDEEGLSPELPLLDLPFGEAVSLGDSARKMRPHLSDPCLYGHYAERLSDHYIRLTCVTADTPHRERMRVGIYGSPDEPGRLAFYATEVDTFTAQTHFDEALEALKKRHGEPAERGPTHALWKGRGRSDNSPVTLRLEVLDVEVLPEPPVVVTTWTHEHLERRLEAE